MIGIFPFKTEVELKIFPKATVTFVFICCIVHLVTWRISKLNPDELEIWFRLTGFTPYFPPTALSHIFVHNDFDHLFFNMLFFLPFAAALEVIEGKRKFWISVIVSAFFSSYFQAFVNWMFYLWTSSADPYIEAAKY